MPVNTGMKTTIEIDDGLVRLLKRRAANKDDSLSGVINSLLRNALAFEEQQAGVAAPFQMITFGGPANSVQGRPEVLKQQDDEVDYAKFREQQR